MADEQRKHTMKKSVSFSQDVLVNLDVQCKMKHRQKMHRTPEEFQTVLADLYDEANWARSLAEKELHQNDHLRGLEMLLDNDAVMERRKQKLFGHLAVFMEQDRQFLEDGSITPKDSDSMAQRYGSITKHSKNLARKRAIFYQEMEKRHRDETELDQRIPMPDASLEPRPRRSVGPSAA
jgi:uncharacterized protein YacL (UPF0231 family)